MPSPLAFLAQYAVQAPQLLIWLAGIALAIAWWQRAPKVALVTCIACGLFLLDALIGTAILVVLPSMMIDNGQSAPQIGNAFALISGVRSLLHAVIWVAVLFAIFSGRSTAPAGNTSL
ncbi:MAG: hypothetical protein ABIV47_28120 [Roseiflexaceae bacterium]